ncbi:MAG: fumarate hydratase C-terminal domain-containing protein [Clostridia bacterium]|nr:fumarate hydratase C-terminal domain-containing protein [Clostridia bacterium]
MSEYHINVTKLSSVCPRLKVGDRVFLSGEVYTARDAAHKRIFDEMAVGKKPPFEIAGAVIYYAGPTPAPEGLAVGSCGPTTSARMDKYTPALLDMGLAATVGKGERSREVVDSIVKNGSVYLCAIGGAGALACRHIKKCEVIAYEDLGCESVKKLTFDDFPLTVGIDSKGNSIFKG